MDDLDDVTVGEKNLWKGIAVAEDYSIVLDDDGTRIERQ